MKSHEKGSLIPIEYFLHDNICAVFFRAPKFVSPQSAFLVLPENSPYLKKKQSCNQNISSTWLEIRCTFVVDVNIC